MQTLYQYIVTFKNNQPSNLWDEATMAIQDVRQNPESAAYIYVYTVDANGKMTQDQVKSAEALLREVGDK